MNPKSLLISIPVAFVTVWATDFLIHGVWLAGAYKATASLWRPEAEMMARMPWMLLAQFLVAAAFTTIFAACVAEKRCMSCTIKFAACMGIFSGGGQLMMYAVQPFPGSLVAKWVLAAIVQAVVLGIVVHKVYRPAPLATEAAGK
jgi:hypothetical protein